MKINLKSSRAPVLNAVERSERLIAKLMSTDEKKALEEASQTAAINFDGMILSVLAEKYGFNGNMLIEFFSSVSALSELRHKGIETRLDYIPELKSLKDDYGIDVPKLYGRADI